MTCPAAPGRLSGHVRVALTVEDEALAAAIVRLIELATELAA